MFHTFGLPTFERQSLCRPRPHSPGRRPHRGAAEVDVDEDGFLTLSEFLELIQQTLGAVAFLVCVAFGAVGGAISL